MKLNITFIKQQFQNIEQTYHLKWTTVNDYDMTLENDKVEISIGAERWEEGVIMSYTNKQKKEFYYIGDLLDKNALPYDSELFYTASEKLLSDTLNDDDGAIHYFRVVLERYCQEVLQGNFSILGKGRPE